MFQGSLFDQVPTLPSGFGYYEEFLTIPEEAELLKSVQALELTPFKFQGFEAKRKVKSYGLDYSFSERKLREGEMIPAFLQNLIDKVSRVFGLTAKEIIEILVTEYPAGAVINWHRDAFPFEKIFGISLLQECKFRLRPYDPLLRTKSSLTSLPVSRRSIYVMEGEARYAWQHSILPVPSTRYSITMRTAR